MVSRDDIANNYCSLYLAYRTLIKATIYVDKFESFRKCIDACQLRCHFYSQTNNGAIALKALTTQSIVNLVNSIFKKMRTYLYYGVGARQGTFIVTPRKKKIFWFGELCVNLSTIKFYDVILL